MVEGAESVTKNAELQKAGKFPRFWLQPFIAW